MSLTALAKRIRRFAVNGARRIFMKARIFMCRWQSSLAISGTPILNQPLLAVGSGILKFDGVVRVGYFPSPYFFSSCAYIEARNPGATIYIGDGTHISNGFTAIAEFSTIRIGRRVLIGTNVEILDSDFHGIEVGERSTSKSDWAKPVEIGDDVFIGSNVRIMKGVTVGRGAVVANSAVVVRDVPEFAIVGGNPAKIIRLLERRT